MSKPVKMYDLLASGNSLKVRLALNLKKIPYEKISIDPSKREMVIQVSGQPLTPVLTHGDSVVYDSYGILRYIDANWPTAPRLFSPVRETMKKIEEWELFQRTEVSKMLHPIYGEFFATDKNMENVKKGNEQARLVAQKIETTLENQPFLTGNEMNAADLTVGAGVWFGFIPETKAKIHPVFSFFHQNLKIAGFPKTKAWVEKIMAFDK